MTRPLALAALLPLLLAAPPAAAEFGEAACQRHGEAQLRCAVQVPAMGPVLFAAVLDTGGAPASARGRLDILMGRCDAPLAAVRQGLPVQGGTGEAELFRRGVYAIGMTCFEAFIMDCTNFASATPCGFAFPAGTPRLVVRRQFTAPGR